MYGTSNPVPKARADSWTYRFNMAAMLVLAIESQLSLLEGMFSPKAYLLVCFAVNVANLFLRERTSQPVSGWRYPNPSRKFPGQGGFVRPALLGALGVVGVLAVFGIQEWRLAEKEADLAAERVVKSEALRANSRLAMVVGEQNAEVEALKKRSAQEATEDLVAVRDVIRQGENKVRRISHAENGPEAMNRWLSDTFR